MFDRRQILLTGAAAAALSPALAAAAPQAEGARLNALFDAFVEEQLDEAPEFATSLGVDKGKRAHQKSELSHRSLAEVRRYEALVAGQLARLRKIDRSKLSGTDLISYDVVLYGLAQQDADNKRFDYGGGGVGGPYVLSQLTGAYQSTPDFLDSQHAIAVKADADAYLARLAAFGRTLDEETALTRHDIGLGVTPPDFVLTRALDQMTKLRAQPAETSVLVASLVRRTKDKSIAGDWGTPAKKIVDETIYPALDRQIALLKSLQAGAVHDAGVWRLKDGDAYYAASIEQTTTTTMSPKELHQMGLDVVADHTAKIDVLMKANGLTAGTVGERLRAMYDDPKFRYPNTDDGKEKLIADLNAKVHEIRALLPKYYGTLPKAELIITRVPKYIEAGAPGGYYNSGSLDGARPGNYYINLRDTAEVPSWTLPTLTYHEGIPGHHLQISIAQETTLPLIRKIVGFTAYVEGWALYSEQCAAEMGLYDNDPWGHIGQLHDAMFRGVRLVVDSGMHAMHWSREQAVKYYVDTLGDQDASAITEIERYCVWPGQACAYMVGKLTILRLRDKAKTALGAKFDIREFHDAVLLGGAVPLTVLETIIDGYIAARQAKA